MKKYELTQEQVEELSKTKHGKRNLKKWFPEAFETKLDVGKWYIYKHYLVHYLGNYKCNCIKLSDGEWIENVRHSLSSHFKSYRLATEEEVVKALINEAIKRGYKKGVKCKFGTSKEIRTIETNNFFFEFNSNKLYLRHSSGDNADEIFRNGFWAEIVSEYIPTQEEIDRVINYLKNK